MRQQIKLLGRLEIEEGGSPAAIMRYSKGCALLVYLIVTQQTHSREAIADLLWDASSTTQSLRNLRKLLSQIRPLVPALQVTRKQLSFQTDNSVSVDLYALREALANPAIPQKHTGLALYRGNLLADFYLEKAPRFNEWLLVEQEHLRQQVWHGYQLVCRAYRTQEAWQKGVEAARSWLAIDELDEEVQRELIQFLAADGLVRAAIEQYEKCRHLLWDELGVEPEPATTDLYDQLRATAQHLAEKEQTLFLGKQHHWGEAPQATAFYGREGELDTLTGWLTREQAHLVTILGIGGQGKTALATVVARFLAGQFEGIFWRSLINAPPLKIILPDYLSYLSQHQTLLPTSLPEQFEAVRRHLQGGRYLLVLDNMETIMDGSRAGRFRQGYEDYEQLLHFFGQGGHESCLLITSRESPALLTRLSQQSPLVRKMQLDGLTARASAGILAAEAITTTVEMSTTLTQRYSGNPLALKLVAQSIQEFYFGDMATFLEDDTFIFDDIRDVLDQQFQRLTPLEQEILVWLAITRETTTPQELSILLPQLVRQRQLLEAMKKLQRRSLLDRGRQDFTLQNVVTEYLTDYLITQVCEEISTGQLTLLNKHALLLARTKAYIRQSQQRIILQPIGQQLRAMFGSDEAIGAKVKALLDNIRGDSRAKNSYVAGNLLNLLLHLDFDVAGYDFSRLSIRQAYLQGATLPAVDFTSSDLTSSVFTDTFGTVQAVAYSPDGELLAAGTQKGEIWLWRQPDGQLLQIISEDLDTIWSIAFSPDGQTLASSGADHKVRLWDVHSGQLQRILVGHTLAVWSVAFSPDGNMLVSGSDDHTVRLWDAHAGHLLSILAEDTGSARAVAYSPHGKLVATGSDDHAIQLWDMDTRQVRHTLHGHKNLIHALAFSPDGGTLVSGAHDDTVFLWDVRTGSVRHALQGHSGWVWSVAFSPDGTMLAVASDDFTVRVWGVRDGRLRYALTHAAWIWSVAFSPDGQILASGGSDFRVRLWDARSGQLREMLQGHSSLTRSVAFSPDRGTLASGGEDRIVHLWDVSTLGSVRHKLRGHSSQVLIVTYNPDGKTVATGSEDRTIRLWDAVTGGLRFVLRGHKDRVFGLAFSPDGHILASGGWDQKVCLWNVYNGQVYQRFQVEEGKLYHVAFSPDGRTLAVANTEGTVCLWDISAALNTSVSDAEQRPAVLRGHSASVTTIAFSPDGEILASGSQDQTVRLWDVNGEAHRILSGHSSRIWSVAFSPDGETLASASVDRTVRLWDVQSGAVRLILRGHSLAVYSAAFSPDGQVVASSSGDETIKFWDVQTGECLHTIQIPGPYEGMNITGITGVTEAQKSALMALGAVVLPG